LDAEVWYTDPESKGNGTKTGGGMSDQDLEAKIYESMTNAAQSAVNYGFLLNGSAAVGILTFLGSDAGASLRGALSRSLIAFSIGVIIAAISALLLYMTQLSYYKLAQDGSQPFMATATSLRVLFLLVVFLSIVAFAFGVIDVARSIS
jgi:hypothetical protein